MGYFAGLAAKLAGTREGIIPTAQLFPAVDQAQLARTLRLEQRSAELGMQQRPNFSATLPDPVESEIDGEIEERARRAHAEYQAQCSAYEARIRNAIITREQRVAVEAAGKNTLSDFTATIRDDSNHLFLAAKRVQETSRALQIFKERNQLSRPPADASSWQRLAAWLGLIVLVLFEAFLNGSFFAKGSELGLVGGMTQALILSVLNVGGAMLYAIFGLPRLVHRKVAWKLVGAASTVIWVGWLVVVNLAIGHFRDLYAIYGDNLKMSDLITELTTHPFLMRDVQSMILWLLGIGVGIVVVIEIAVSRELYPGYAAVAKQEDLAITDYSTIKTERLKGLQELRDAAVSEMKDALRAIDASSADFNQAMQGRADLHRGYAAYLNHLTQVRSHMINLYRDANRAARTTAAPAYFSENAARLAYLASVKLEQMPEPNVHAGAECANRIQGFIQELNERFEKALSSYPTVEKLTAGEETVRGAP